MNAVPGGCRSRQFIVAQLIIACSLLAFRIGGAQAADEPSPAARATLDRIEALRQERPGDGVLVFYEAVVHISLGEREAALELLRSLKGRKLGLIPVRDSGFDAVWDDAKFQAIRKELIDEEPRTPESPVAFRLKDPKLIPEGIAFDPERKTLLHWKHGATQDHRGGRKRRRARFLRAYG